MMPRRLDEVDPVIVVLLDPGRDAKMFGSKMMSSGGKPTSSVRIRVGARADLDLAGLRVGLALLVERHHDHGRPVIGGRSGLVL